MKSILLATTFLAAFATSAMAAKATTNLPASPAYNWTGAYVGGQLGYSWGDSRFNDGARINRHSGFNFGVMCDSWGSGFGDLEPFDVETEALRTEC
jgi:opacity protein-like surface antigen